MGVNIFTSSSTVWNNSDSKKPMPSTAARKYIAPSMLVLQTWCAKAYFVPIMKIAIKTRPRRALFKYTIWLAFQMLAYTFPTPIQKWHFIRTASSCSRYNFLGHCMLQQPQFHQISGQDLTIIYYKQLQRCQSTY